MSSGFFAAYDVSASTHLTSPHAHSLLSFPSPDSVSHFSLHAILFTVFSRIHLSWGKKLSTFSAFPLNIHFSYCPQLNLGSLKRILLLLWFSLSCTSQTAILGSWLLHLSVKPPASLRSGLTHCQFSWLLLGTTSWDSPVHILMYPYAVPQPHWVPSIHLLLLLLLLLPLHLTVLTSHHTPCKFHDPGQ